MSASGFIWYELLADDVAAAARFYAAQFGWGTAIGGMMDVPGTERPYWLIYFNVDDIDAAKRRLVTAGGKLDGDLHQVPGDDWILRARDPQGAAFALLGPRWEKHRAV